MKKILLLLLIILSVNCIGQNKKEKMKLGWNMGGFPVIAYNTDLGFQYGVHFGICNYGKDSSYPVYKQMITGEISRYTKGSGKNELGFDLMRISKKINVRMIINVGYYTNKINSFFGFNGAENYYNREFTSTNSSSYISRLFYCYDQKYFTFSADFIGKIKYKWLKWQASVLFNNYDIGTVDIKSLNKGKDEDKKLPDTTLLYDKYVEWGIIPSGEKNGGHNQLLKFGIVYDTRDIEANPSKGIWSDITVLTAPRFLGNGTSSYTNLIINHRQYFNLWKHDLTFVYRLGYQGKISGHIPFYVATTGLGGAKTLRGIMSNRVTGNGYAFGNIEFRWKFSKFILWRQNFYFAASTFFDAGRVVQDVKFDKSLVPATEIISDYFTGKKEALHCSYGAGLHIGYNQNIVIACDYGRAINPQDGKYGLYIGLNWLF
jgi:hypothetical protein